MATTTTPDGTTIAYDVHGEGESTVVLVHGITESRGSWDPIVERLAADQRVVALDLRGHGESGTADDYGLAAMGSDVLAVVTATGAERPHLVGHSLGGAVVSAVGAALPVGSVVDVDQSLRLGEFTEQLKAVEPQLRDVGAFPAVIAGIFEQMAGGLAGTAEFDRISDLRRPDQPVVLGVWDMLLTSDPGDVERTVDLALAGYDGLDVAHLSIFGIDPGDDYADWIASKIDGAVTEVWDGAGHYPHLVDPDRFVARLREFWSDV